MRGWKAQGFGSSSIRIALEHLQRQLSRFTGKDGDLGLAAAASDWLAIQEAVNELLQLPAKVRGAADIDRRRTAKPKRRFPVGSAKKAVLQAMTALGKPSTTTEVRAYLRRNSELLEGANPSDLEHNLGNIRLARFCVPQGKNEEGEVIFRLRETACPFGVRMLKANTYSARMHFAQHHFSGPRRTCEKAASKDVQKLQRWKKTINLEALLKRVREWPGARVIPERNAKK